MNAALKSPFPWFGGKRPVAAEIWQRFGAVRNYVEPFFGSGAVLLARPNPQGVETINDADGMVSNFWRAIKTAPDQVARWADWPVSEIDLHARHYWLVTEGKDRLARCLGDPEGYDAQVAGWWVWGICAFIGGEFCSGKGPWQWMGGAWVKRGDDGAGVSIKIPHLGNAGRGINRALPHLGNAGQGIMDYLGQLSDRLRGVRIAHGDWSRVTGDSVTWRHGKTAVFLDPPYAAAMRESVYAHEDDCAAAARAWAIDAGKRPDMLICLAGYDGEHDMPDGWSAYRWKARGGFGSQSNKRGRENAAKETLWFSPACNPPQQETLL
jgi:DNA adenine methylase